MKTILLTMLISGFATAAHAAVFLHGLSGDPAYAVQSEYLNRQIADDFSMSTSFAVAAVRFWGSYNLPPLTDSDLFTVRIFAAGDNGLPQNGAPLDSVVVNLNRTDSGFRFGTKVVYVFEADINSSVMLAAGTTYYLSIACSSDPVGRPPWSWATRDKTGKACTRTGDAGTWALSTATTSSSNFAFELYDTPFSPVPECHAYALVFGVALLGFSIIHRFRQRLAGNDDDGVYEKEYWQTCWDRH